MSFDDMSVLGIATIGKLPQPFILFVTHIIPLLSLCIAQNPIRSSPLNLNLVCSRLSTRRDARDSTALGQNFIGLQLSANFVLCANRIGTYGVGGEEFGRGLFGNDTAFDHLLAHRFEAGCYVCDVDIFSPCFFALARGLAVLLGREN